MYPSATQKNTDKAPAITGKDFFAIPLAAMQPGTVTPVDLFIRVASPMRFVLYKKSLTPLRDEIRERLLAHDVQVLYLQKGDEAAYHAYLEENLSRIIRDDMMPKETACRLVYESSSRVMQDVFQNPRSGRNVQRAHAMVEATVLSIIKDPEAIWHMTALASHDYYTYTHCVNVCMFLVAASRDMLGITELGILQQIGLGGLFHDLGKSQIPGEILTKPGKLTAEEFEKVKQHPLLGIDLVKRDQKMPTLAAQIIRSHHERFDGKGYPSMLSGDSIGRLARLASVIDVYDALTTKRSYADARDPYHAVEMMLKKMDGQFDEALLHGFVKFLGPKESRLELRARWDPAVAEALGLTQKAVNAQPRTAFTGAA